MRVLFPTYSAEDSFYTKTPFDFAKWSVKAENSEDFLEPDTLVHPSQGITRIGEKENPAALYTRGLYETEVTDNQEKALAVTLFRAAEYETGTTHTKDIKMLRDMTFEYAFSLASRTMTETLLEGERYRAGIQEFRFEQNREAETLEGSGSFLELSESQKILSHFSERNGIYTIRLYDISGQEENVTVTLPKTISSMKYTDLEGTVTGEAAVSGNRAEIVCPPHKIVTLQVKIEEEE